jgi:hypothetical protein
VSWKALCIAVTATVAMHATAGELTLFDVELRTATTQQLHQAAVAAGARLLSSAEGRRVYDVAKVGLPGARRLEVLFDGDRFVVAAYTFDDNRPADHELRRLLVAKYGPPYVILSGGKRYEPDITARYPDIPSGRWDMDAPMELIYTQFALNPKKFGGTETRLTYVNRTAFEELQRRVQAEGKQADKARAAQLKRTF